MPVVRACVAQEEFGRSSYTTSGLASYCKACTNAASSDAYFLRKYKLTQPQLRALREPQGDCCGICGAPEPQHLDHDHFTGRIRQLLCQRCNHGLGLFRDDPFLLRMAALYVDTHREEHEVADRSNSSHGESEGANRPGEPPVGSDRRPAGRDASTRTTGRTSGSRRRKTAGEADG